MAIYEVQSGLLRQVLAWVNVQVNMGNITDAVVAALTTTAGLKAITFSSGFETQRRFYEMYQKAIDRGVAIGALTDAAVAAAGSVAGLRAVFTSLDANLTAAQRYSLVAP